MSVEVAVGALVKWLWIPVAGVLGGLTWYVKRMIVKLENTYTKSETENIIDLKLQPIKTLAEQSSVNLDRQLVVVMELLMELSNESREARDRSDQKDEELRAHISEIKTSVAVISAKE